MPPFLQALSRIAPTKGKQKPSSPAPPSAPDSGSPEHRPNLLKGLGRAATYHGRKKSQHFETSTTSKTGPSLKIGRPTLADRDLSHLGELIPLGQMPSCVESEVPKGITKGMIWGPVLQAGRNQDGRGILVDVGRRGVENDLREYGTPQPLFHQSEHSKRHDEALRMLEGTTSHDSVVLDPAEIRPAHRAGFRYYSQETSASTTAIRASTPTSPALGHGSLRLDDVLPPAPVTGYYSVLDLYASASPDPSNPRADEDYSIVQVYGHQEEIDAVMDVLPKSTYASPNFDSAQSADDGTSVERISVGQNPAAAASVWTLDFGIDDEDAVLESYSGFV